MNNKTNKVIVTLIATLMLLAAMVACNRSKSDAATATQAATQQEASTATAPQETTFEFADGVITGYNGTDTVVVIPSQIQGQAVTEIGSAAFRNKQLTGVTIPDSVIEIREYAFNDNPLTSITINGAYIYMGVRAGETDVTFFNEAFDNFYSNNNKQAGTYTLNNGVWSQITPFEFANGIITGYKGTDTTVVIPSYLQGQAVTEISHYAFHGKQLTSVTIPNSLTAIRSSAFAENKLTDVTIPSNVTYIGAAAFNLSPLTSITIGAYVTLEVDYPASGVTAYAFNKAFDDAYNNGGKIPGTYNLNNGVWTLEVDTAFNGTWVREDSQREMKLNNGYLEFIRNGIPVQQGTYTTGDGIIKTTLHRVHGDSLDWMGVEFESKWYSKDELETVLINSDDFPDKFMIGQVVFRLFIYQDYSLSGNTLTSVFNEGSPEIYTRK